MPVGERKGQRKKERERVSSRLPTQCRACLGARSDNREIMTQAAINSRRINDGTTQVPRNHFLKSSRFFVLHNVMLMCLLFPASINIQFTNDWNSIIVHSVSCSACCVCHLDTHITSLQLLHVSACTQRPHGWLQCLHTIFILGEIVTLNEFLYFIMAKCENSATQYVSCPLVCCQKPYSQIYCPSMVIYSTQTS